MLREALSPEGGTSQSARPAAAPVAGREQPVRARPPRLLLVHADDKRLGALQGALAERGYAVEGVELAEACALLNPAIPPYVPPDVLITALDPLTQIDVVDFARRCQCQWRALRVVYITWVTWNAPAPLLPREHVLQAPFTGAELAGSLG